MQRKKIKQKKSPMARKFGIRAMVHEREHLYKKPYETVKASPIKTVAGFPIRKDLGKNYTWPDMEEI
jgi:hypothetical protein